MADYQFAVFHALRYAASMAVHNAGATSCGLDSIVDPGAGRGAGTACNKQLSSMPTQLQTAQTSETPFDSFATHRAASQTVHSTLQPCGSTSSSSASLLALRTCFAFGMPQPRIKVALAKAANGHGQRHLPRTAHHPPARTGQQSRPRAIDPLGHRGRGRAYALHGEDGRRG